MLFSARKIVFVDVYIYWGFLSVVVHLEQHTGLAARRYPRLLMRQSTYGVLKLIPQIAIREQSNNSKEE
jgi:hypothetical protein